MQTKLIVITKNLCFGENLAFSLHSIFGFEEHIIHRASNDLFSRLQSIGIENSFIIMEDGIPGLNYPALIDALHSFSPAYQILLTDDMSSAINTQKLNTLGCGDLISSDSGFKTIVNAILSWLSGESPLDFITEPFQRLSEDNVNYLKDVYHLKVAQIMDKYGFTQQNTWAKKNRLFNKLKLNPDDKNNAFRVLVHLYRL